MNVVDSRKAAKEGGQQPSTLGRPTTTLEAKKAYRQDRAKRAREQQQRVAAEQAAASDTLAAKQTQRRESKAEERAAAEAPL